MASRNQRKAVAEDTVKIIAQGSYTAVGKVVNLRSDIDSAVSGSLLYSPADFTEDFLSVKQDWIRPESSPTIFTLASETTLEGAMKLARSNPEARIGVLNFASAKNPGGGFLSGAGAQEESLARSSALFPRVSQMTRMYSENRKSASCLYFHYMVYSPRVPVFKNDAGNLLQLPYQVDFITAPAPNAGVARERLTNPAEEIKQVMIERIDRILAVCAHQGCDTLVLGAYGCGVFGNSIEEVAWYFRVLLTKKYQNVFRLVHFAVPDRITPFSNVFGKLIKA